MDQKFQKSISLFLKIIESLFFGFEPEKSSFSCPSLEVYCTCFKILDIEIMKAEMFVTRKHPSKFVFATIFNV